MMKGIINDSNTTSWHARSEADRLGKTQLRHMFRWARTGQHSSPKGRPAFVTATSQLPDSAPGRLHPTIAYAFSTKVNPLGSSTGVLGVGQRALGCT